MSAPYSDRVATDYPYARPRGVDMSLVRDLIAVVLVVAGVVGLSVAAFAVDWRLGLAVVSVAAVITGAFLGYER